MTVYRELLEAGYFQDGLSDEEKKAIADKVEGKREKQATTTATKKAAVKK